MKVDFYVLKDKAVQARERYTCRLVEKVYQLAHPIQIIFSDAQKMKEFDELLWTYSETSFVPHEVSSAEPSDARVVLTMEPIEPVADNMVAINLSDKPIELDVARVAEIVDSNNADLAAVKRSHFLHYKQQGCEIVTHNR